jgi:hypothetical protein
MVAVYSKMTLADNRDNYLIEKSVWLNFRYGDGSSNNYDIIGIKAITVGVTLAELELALHEYAEMYNVPPYKGKVNLDTLIHVPVWDNYIG